MNFGSSQLETVSDLSNHLLCAPYRAKNRFHLAETCNGEILQI